MSLVMVSEPCRIPLYCALECESLAEPDDGQCAKQAHMALDSNTS